MCEYTSAQYHAMSKSEQHPDSPRHDSPDSEDSGDNEDDDVSIDQQVDEAMIRVHPDQ